MHLTDSELLTLDEEKAKHLEHCSICQLRYQNRTKLTTHLSQFQPKTGFDDNWQAVLQRRNNHVTDGNVSHLRVQDVFTKVIALAACLTLAVLFYLPYQQQRNLEYQVSQLLENNRVLQQELANLKKEIRHSELSYIAANQQILSLDHVIQHSYTNDQPLDKKRDLWLEREALLKDLIRKQKTPKGIKI